MRFNEGQLVIVIPNTIRKNGFVGKIDRLEEYLTKLCGKDVYLVECIGGGKIDCYASDLRGIGDKLADDIIDEIYEDGRYFVTDDGHKWILYVDDLYYCEDCNEVHNSLDSATEGEEFDMFMVGYLECLNDVKDWFVDDENVTVVAHALHDIGIDFLTKLGKEDYSHFYNLVMNYKEQVKKKPKLTLAEIKEKLGYDFDLAD